MPLKNYQELRYKPDLKKHTHQQKYSNVFAALTHMTGWRKTMEDAHIFQFDIDTNGTHLFAVFDGHGGGEVALFAQRHFKQHLLSHPAYQNGNYDQALLQTFTSIDAAMVTEKGSDEVFQIKDQLDQILRKQFKFDWQEDSDDEVECVAGSTAIVCLMTKETIYIASLGDSRCMICSQGKCTIVSIDHKPELPEEKERIEAAGGKIKNNRINGKLGMSRSLGDFQFKMKKNRPADKQMVISVPHIEKIKNEKIDFILIGCDGIWQGHQNQWYFDLVHSKMNKKENPDQIVEGILENVVAESLDGDDGHDNMTAILVLVQENGQ